MSENQGVHPVVLATVSKQMATAQLRAEQLRSKRNALSTVSAGQQNRAIELGKALREADAIAESWRQALVAMSASTVDFDRLTVTVLADDAPAVCPSDCDYCHHEECPCPRMGCAGDPDRVGATEAQQNAADAAEKFREAFGNLKLIVPADE